LANVPAVVNALRLASVLCSLAAVASRCADLGPTHAEQLREAWRAEQGLPHDAVTCVTQTRDGYLWVGTSNGLARFDGVRFVSYRAADTPDLRSNRILCLCEDRQGRLWIGTDGGGVIRHEHGQFFALTTREGLSSERVTCLVEDEEESLWAGTESGLNRLEKGRFVSFFTLNGLPDDTITSLCPDRGGLLVGTGKGLAQSWEGKWARLNAPLSPGWDGTGALLRDQPGHWWVAGPMGLWRLGLSPNETNGVQLHQGQVSSLLERKDGEICFGSPEGRLFRLGQNRAGPEEMARFRGAVLALREDREGNLWVGTAGDGLHRLKPRQLQVVRTPEGLSPADISGLTESASGTEWLAAGAHGLLRREHGTWEAFRLQGLPENAWVRATVGEPDTGLWIGTRGDGLFRWREGRLQRWSQREGLSDSVIETLCADGREGVWIGTRNGGLNHVQAGEISRVHTPWGFTGNFASVMMRDPVGRLWIGTSGDGLFCYSNGVFLAFATRDGLPHSLVQALLADQDVVWAGTAGGLARIKGGQVKAFTQKDGLPEEAITQLQDDGVGNLWLGSPRGLFRVRKLQLHDYAEGRSRFLDAVSYGKSDGLTDAEVLPGVQMTSAKAGQGRIWFPTSRGLVTAAEGALKWNGLPPPVLLEQVLVENEPVALSNLIRVPPGREKIQFQYTALSLTAPEKVRFRVRLTGFDRDWVDMGGNRTARYTRVPPGRYDFRVMACNNDGLWSDAVAGVSLAVAPFWWQTAWFPAAILALAGAVVAGAIRMHRARRRELERLRVRLAADLHDELGSSLWSITLLSRMLQKDGQMGPEERRDVGDIHRIATQASSAIRDIVWLINPAYDTAQDLVLRMRDFTGTMLRGLEHGLQCGRVDLSRQLPLEFRQNVFLLFKEVITNVAKHAQASQVEIILDESAGWWHLSVSDNGVGFEPGGNFTGHGLKSLRQRAQKIGGRIEITSQPGRGTKVTLAVPCA
jgi:ligand-binding sensor domain-containing protein/signal transduction histidine kinase